MPLKSPVNFWVRFTRNHFKFLKNHDMNRGGRRCFSFSELTIEIGWEDQLSENELGFLLSIVPFREDHGPKCSADIILNCKFASKSIEVSDGDFQFTESYGLSIKNGTEQTIISDGQSVFVIGHKTGQGQITFHSSFHAKFPLAKNNFFLVGLIHLFAQYDYYDLHGAGLTHNGKGFLILGPSGSGKSSLALNLVEKGWHYASDDALIMNANKSDIAVLSFRKQFYVDPALAKCFPELERILTNHSHNKSEKCFIDLDEVWPGRFQPQFIPDKLIFCSVTGGETSQIQPISKTDALLRLLPQSASVFFNRCFAQKQVETLKRLVEQTHCYQLDAGIDIYEKPNKAARMLSSI